MIDNPYITILEGIESIQNLSDGEVAYLNLSFNVFRTFRLTRFIFANKFKFDIFSLGSYI